MILFACIYGLSTKLELTESNINKSLTHASGAIFVDLSILNIYDSIFFYYHEKKNDIKILQLFNCIILFDIMYI